MACQTLTARLAVAGVFAFACALNASNTCGVSDLKGTFATQPHGLLLASPPGGPPAGPFAATGSLTFDGAGRFAGITSSSFDGVILYPFAAKGHYTITPDCKVTATEETLGIVFEGYFSRDKNEVIFFQPQAYTVSTNVIKALPVRACRTEDFKDNWAIQVNGTNVTAGQSFAGNGRLAFDGHGGFTGVTASSLGGVIARHSVSGTINVNSDCSLTMTMTDESANVSHLYGVIYGDRSEFYFIYQTPGLVITGIGTDSASTRSGDE